MPCYHPIDGYRGFDGAFTASRQQAYIDQPLTVSCGQCIGCRLELSRQWATRSMHESQMHENSCFITNTYDDENLPYGETLHRPHWVKFIKRLRKKTSKFRIYYCGEYGGQTERPHYHGLLFGFRPTDGKFYSENDGNILYTSKFLDDTWTHGQVLWGELTFDSAAYVSRYCTDKKTGELAETYYQKIDPDTGEIIDRVHPFSGSSNQPGIGIPWLLRYGEDAYSHDCCIMQGKEIPLPRAYDRYIKENDNALWTKISGARQKKIHDSKQYNHSTVLKKGVLTPQVGFGYDPDAYKGTNRQLLAGEKIITQRMQKRTKL